MNGSLTYPTIMTDHLMLLDSETTSLAASLGQIAIAISMNGSLTYLDEED